MDAAIVIVKFAFIYVKTDSAIITFVAVVTCTVIRSIEVVTDGVDVAPVSIPFAFVDVVAVYSASVSITATTFVSAEGVDAVGVVVAVISPDGTFVNVVACLAVAKESVSAFALVRTSVVDAVGVAYF